MFLELRLTEAKADIFPVSTPERNKSTQSSHGLQSEKKVKEVLLRRSSTRLSGKKKKEASYTEGSSTDESYESDDSDEEFGEAEEAEEDDSL